MNLAWHFVGDKLRDGRPVPPDGEWLEHDGPLVMCESGLHFSRHPFDALQYAPGETLCMVEIGGEIVEGTEKHKDKGICSRRRIVKRVDATELLRSFSRQQALSVAHLWDMPAVVREYLETGDESKRTAAWDAAWAAARAAAGAARDAAGAARDAAGAARDAAGAAWAAAREAAWAAARAAAWAAAREAAGDAAWDAAWAAAGDAQREHFANLVNKAFTDRKD